MKKTDLINAIKNVLPGVGDKGIVEEAKYILFTPDELVSFNDSISVRMPVKLEAEVNGLIPANGLVKILSELPNDDIKLEVKEDKLVIVSGKYHVELNMTQSERFSSMAKLELPKKGWTNVVEDFLAGMKYCLNSVSKNMTRLVLTGICVDGVHLTSSDNHRVTQYKMKGEMKSFLIPGEAAAELSKYAIVSYVVTEQWIHFNAKPGLIFSSRLIDGAFPDVSKILEVKGTKIPIPKGLDHAVMTSGLIVNEDFDLDRKIKVIASKKKIHCEGKSDSGTIKVDVPAEYDGDPLTFFINPEFFHKILSAKEAPSMIFSEGKLLFRAGSLKHLIALAKE